MREVASIFVIEILTGNGWWPYLMFATKDAAQERLRNFKDTSENPDDFLMVEYQPRIPRQGRVHQKHQI